MQASGVWAPQTSITSLPKAIPLVQSDRRKVLRRSRRTSRRRRKVPRASGRLPPAPRGLEPTPGAVGGIPGRRGLAAGDRERSPPRRANFRWPRTSFRRRRRWWVGPTGDRFRAPAARFRGRASGGRATAAPPVSPCAATLDAADTPRLSVRSWSRPRSRPPPPARRDLLPSPRSWSMTISSTRLPPGCAGRLYRPFRGRAFHRAIGLAVISCGPLNRRYAACMRPTT